MKNNCLFDAVIAYEFNYESERISQLLRDKCNELLENVLEMPIIPDNHPAGEQYLIALSQIFDKKINVYKGKTSYVVSYKENLPLSINIRHLGSDLNGHWVAAERRE